MVRSSSRGAMGLTSSFAVTAPTLTGGKGGYRRSELSLNDALKTASERSPSAGQNEVG